MSVVGTHDKWLHLDSEQTQNELRSIPYINKRVKATDKKVPYELLEEVLKRLNQNGLGISIFAYNSQYELILVGTGRWKQYDEDGNKTLYRSIGKTTCDSMYECFSKATLCLYKFIKYYRYHKLE